MSLPIVAGHRGFKSKYVENTIQGFHECYKTGATIIETDLWLSQDEVLVVSHDMNTNRIFCDEQGNSTDYNILQTSYKDVLQKLRVIGSDEHLMNFRQLLNWFVDYVENEEIGNPKKIMLDLKPVNPTRILKFIIEDLLYVKNDIKWWYNRIQFGLWKLNFIKYFNQEKYFQTKFGESNDQGMKQFDIINISFSWKYSMVFLNYNQYLDELPDKSSYKIKTTGISLIYLATWSVDFISNFLPIIKFQNLKFYSWTINFKRQFDYFVKICHFAKLNEYGVISDVPDEMEKLKSNPIEFDEKHSLIESIELSWFQKLAYFFFCRIFDRAINVNPEDFESIVDEYQTVVIKPNPVARWFFVKLQHLGIL